MRFPELIESCAKAIADEPEPHWTTIEIAMQKAYRWGFSAGVVRSAELCASVRDEYASPDRREPAHRCAERVLAVGLCEAAEPGISVSPLRKL